MTDTTSARPRTAPGTGDGPAAAEPVRVPAPAPAPAPSSAPAGGAEERADAAAGLRAHIDALYPARPGEAELREISALPDDCALPPGTAVRLDDALVRPVRRLIERGGHRWRPRLATAAVEALGGDPAGFGPLLAAAEILHTGSLIVDDVQDGAVRRRGAPAVHVEFGLAAALNAGTAAYFSLDRVVPHLSRDPLTQVAMYRSFMAALRAAHAGQGLDIAGHREVMDAAAATGDARPVLEAVRLTHRLKSGAPVRCLMELVAHTRGTDDAPRRALARYGEAVGTAYQITDDVQDLTGVVRDGAPTKLIGEDLHNGKVTMPLAHAVALLPRAELTALWQSVRTPGADPGTVREAITALVSCGALRAAREEADHLVERAWTALSPHLPPSEAATRLHTLGRATVRRSRLA
ncbi:polyprenyl synthetase family protein [Streptomyces sp. NPDC004042]|uniref:polyprenyl synthetase family protein n=1 Tax=Streptomyces sp. NPDC004042 TaxID=3154451 RepID=UPI0033AD9715